MNKHFNIRSGLVTPRLLITLFCLTGFLLALLAFHATSSPSANAQEQPAEPQPLQTKHKISVSDRSQIEKLQELGARIIADYGSFILMEANEAAVRSAANVHGTQSADHNNLILLNAGTIDTNTPQAQSTRSTTNSGSGSGNQMRLIQFAGPIRPEWYQRLEDTGAKIVTYIPNNTYLVYGNGATLQAVRTLASDAAIVQWDGEYTAAYRIDPTINNPSQSKGLPPANLSKKGNEQFVIQMVEDQRENAVTLALIDQSKREPIITQERALGYFNVKVALPKEAVFQIAQRGDVVSIQPWVTPRKQDERQDIIVSGNVTGPPFVPTPMNYLTYLTGKGFNVTTSSTFAVNISDSGVDDGTTTPNHFGLYRIGDPTVPANSRIIYNRLEGTPNVGSTIQGCDGHVLLIPISSVPTFQPAQLAA